MLRTSFGLPSRRLCRFHNTSPNALRSRSGQTAQHSCRRVSALRALGLFACTATAALVVHYHENPAVSLDAGRQTPENRQVEPETRVGFAPDATQVESESGVEFPMTIRPHSCPPLTILGAGCRKISYLGLKVYAIAFYANMSNIRVPKDATFEEKMEHIISNSTVAIRIVPVRSSNYSHLRDAFIRTLRGRILIARKKGDMTPDQEDALEEPLTELRSIFPNKRLNKGTALVVYSQTPKDGTARSLVFEGLGQIDSAWISKELFKAYFVGEGNSPTLLKSVKETVESL